MRLRGNAWTRQTSMHLAEGATEPGYFGDMILADAETHPGGMGEKRPC